MHFLLSSTLSEQTCVHFFYLYRTAVSSLHLFLPHSCFVSSLLSSLSACSSAMMTLVVLLQWVKKPARCQVSLQSHSLCSESLTPHLCCCWYQKHPCVSAVLSFCHINLPLSTLKCDFGVSSQCIAVFKMPENVDEMRNPIRSEGMSALLHFLVQGRNL